MNKYILGLLFLIISSPSFAQIDEGVVVYNRKQDWIAIMEKLPFMTAEEVSRAKFTWGKNESDGTNYVLTFKDNKSVYTYKEEESEGNYSWKKEKFLLIRDQKKRTAKDQRELLGKTYLIEDDIPKKRWKILNEIKEVGGHLCMKASTRDESKNQHVVAWFANSIPFSGGPEGYGGLPGLILELNINDGEIVVTSTDVKIEAFNEKLPIPKKIKGKDISFVEFDEKVSKYIKKTIEGKKNPYWRIRY